MKGVEEVRTHLAPSTGNYLTVRGKVPIDAPTTRLNNPLADSRSGAEMTLAVAVKVNELAQRRFLRGTRSFRVGEDRKIAVSYRTTFSRHDYQVELEELTGLVVRVKYAKLSKLVSAGIFIVVGLLLAWAMYNDNTLSDLWFLPLIGASPALLFGLAYWRSIDDLVILRRHDGTSALVMFASSPTATRVEAFVANVCNTISAQNEESRNARACIRGLYDLGVLSGDEARTLSDRISVKLKPVV